MSGTDDLELDLENLDINDDALELDCGDEAEDLTKKLLDEQGKNNMERYIFVFISFPKLNLLPSQSIAMRIIFFTVLTKLWIHYFILEAFAIVHNSTFIHSVT